jgi:hypothetical protein
MRTCARLRCEAAPAATVTLRYQAREVVVGDLAPQRDPNLVDLCPEHVERLTPPRGWTVRDERTVRTAGSA